MWAVECVQYSDPGHFLEFDFHDNSVEYSVAAKYSVGEVHVIEVVHVVVLIVFDSVEFVVEVLQHIEESEKNGVELVEQAVELLLEVR